MLKNKLVLACALASMLALVASCTPLQEAQFTTGDRAKILDELKGPTPGTIEETLLLSATTSMDQGNYERASQFYQQLLDKSPSNIKYALGLAESKRRAGKYADAQKIYDAILEKSPENLDAKEGKGLALMALGDTAQAGKIFDEIIARDRARWRTLNAAGILFAGRGMTDEALTYFEQALIAKKDNPSVMNNAGLALAMDKQYENAIEAMNRALRLLPADSPQRKQMELNLSMIYALAGKMEESEQLASKHLKGPALYNNMGLFAHLAKDDSMAKSYLNMALTRAHTDYERAWDNLDFITKLATSKKEDTSVKVIRKSGGGAGNIAPSAGNNAGKSSRKQEIIKDESPANKKEDMEQKAPEEKDGF